ncbi:MAG: PAS domain S-box protein [Deltaproteobacteria bacterium]|nr:PAS domain S-box protein [Deltaproteobacteria bacterium]
MVRDHACVIQQVETGDMLLGTREKLLGSAIEQATDPIALADLDSRLIYVNRAFACMHGYSPEEMIGMKLVDLEAPEHPEPYPEIAERIRNKGSWRGEIGHVRKDGTRFHVYVSASLVKDEMGGPPFILLIMVDVSGQKRKEEEMERFSRHMMASIEKEKRRLALDLHDELAQDLAVLFFEVENLKLSLPPDLTGEIAICDKIMNEIETLGNRIRKISWELMPDIIEQVGLFSALEWSVNEFSQRRQDIRFHLSLEGEERRLEQDKAIVIYRIFQEAMTNIIKHSGAANAKIILAYRPREITLSIRDDGVGFDMRKYELGHGTGGIGLMSMRERARSVGGTLVINTEKGKGTWIKATIPDP